MKPILFITTVLFFLSAQADITNYNEQQVIIKDKKINHNEWNIPADMPDVYYNNVSGLTVGNHVDTNRTSGDFIIPSAKQFEVEYSDKVVLAPGFKVNKGGVFKARRGASTYKNR